MKHRAYRQKFIKDWLKSGKDYHLDIFSEEFHSAYAEEFGAKLERRWWGPRKCPDAMRQLKILYDSGYLKRSIITTDCGGGGCSDTPHWIYVYRLSEWYERLIIKQNRGGAG